MKKIAFYSYKGGVGRTKLLIATALKLAKNGSKVAILDLDDDAPSIIDIFGDKRSDIGSNELLHLLFEAKTDSVNILRSRIDKTDYLKKVYPDSDKEGSLSYIPTISHSDFRREIDYDSFNFTNNLKSIFQVLIDENIDYVLIDTRPGVSSSASKVIPIVDKIVFVTRLDIENFNGIERYCSDTIKDEKTILIANLVPKIKLSDDMSKQESNDLKKISTIINSRYNEFHKHLKRIGTKIYYNPIFSLDNSYEFMKTIEDSSLNNGLDYICKEIK